MYLYNYFLYNYFLYNDIFFCMLAASKQQLSYSYLYFFLRKNRLFINIVNYKKLTLFLLTTGFYLKLLKKDKKFKKTKTIRYVLLRHLRKLLLVLKQTRLFLINKASPLFINELIYFLNQPLPIKFYNPILTSYIDDSTMYTPLTYIGLMFCKTQSYTQQKKKKFRFLKRKVKRRIVLQNKIID